MIDKSRIVWNLWPWADIRSRSLRHVRYNWHPTDPCSDAVIQN
jgi:hypothetical protein